MNTRALTLSALMAALSVSAVFLGILIPVMNLSFTAIAGVFSAVATYKCGIRAGLMTWLTASVLCLFLAAAQPTGILYACMFGLYPVVKTLCERAGRPVVARAGKFVFAHLGGGAAVAAYALFFPGLLEEEFLSEMLFLDSFAPFIKVMILLFLYWAVFVLYDIALSRILHLLQKRFPNRRAGE